MAQAPYFDFSAPIVDVQQVGPTGQTSAPYQGNTTAARHAGYIGAKAADITWAANTAKYVALLKRDGPISDQTAAARLGWGVSSINSIRAGLGDQVQPSGQFETATFARKTTRRVMWRWVGK